MMRWWVHGNCLSSAETFGLLLYASKNWRIRNKFGRVKPRRPRYRRASTLASSSTTPSPHSALAIFLLMYSPSCQYSETSSELTASYARPRAASTSATTSLKRSSLSRSSLPRDAPFDCLGTAETFLVLARRAGAVDGLFFLLV